MSTATNEKIDVYQIVTEQITALLTAGTVPWRKPWNGDGQAINLASKKPYRGINAFLLACAPYTSPYWATFKQISDLGGKVRKGEKSTLVIFWKMYETKDKHNEDETKVVPVLRYYRVFNLDQCDGITAPDTDGASSRFEHDPIEAAEAIALAMQNRPVVTFGGDRAFYSPARDAVTVPALCQYRNPSEYYSTYFHELAHATGHESRLNREGITSTHFFGDAVYSREELVAEMSAAFLCGEAGIVQETITNSAAYIQGWLKALKNDKKLVVVAAAQAQKAADYILNR